MPRTRLAGIPQHKVFGVPPRQNGLGNPKSIDSPHPHCLLLQIRLHLGVVPREPASHFQSVCGVERQIGEADFLHPLRQAPRPLVAAHQTRPAVPFARHRSAIDTRQGVQVHVVGRAQPVGHLVGTGDSQQRLAPVVAPPRLLLGLERLQRHGQRRIQFASSSRKRLPIRGYGCSNHDVVTRRSLLGQDRRGLVIFGDTVLRPNIAGSQHDCGAAAQQWVAVRVEVVIHPRVGQMGPRRPCVDLDGVNRCIRRAQHHRGSPLGQFDRRWLQNATWVDHLDYQDLSLGVSPDLEPSAVRLAAELNHDATAV